MDEPDLRSLNKKEVISELRTRARNMRDAIPDVVGARRAIMEADAKLMERAADLLQGRRPAPHTFY